MFTITTQCIRVYVCKYLLVSRQITSHNYNTVDQVYFVTVAILLLCISLLEISLWSTFNAHVQYFVLCFVNPFIFAFHIYLSTRFVNGVVFRSIDTAPVAYVQWQRYCYGLYIYKQLLLDLNVSWGRAYQFEVMFYLCIRNSNISAYTRMQPHLLCIYILFTISLAFAHVNMYVLQVHNIQSFNKLCVKFSSGQMSSKASVESHVTFKFLLY